METRQVSRRRFLKTTGGLIVSFNLLPSMSRLLAQAPGRPTTTDPAATSLDSWLAVAPDGTVTVFTSKVELGTGIETALAQIVAEELDLPFQKIKMDWGDTSKTIDQGGTVASRTIERAAPQLRQAAAAARQQLLKLAAARFEVGPDQLTVRDGVVSVTGNPAKKVSYAELIGGKRFNLKITATGTTWDLKVAPEVKAKDPKDYKIVGTSVPRIDLPPKFTGEHTYVQDVRVPGMLHGRVVRPPVVNSKPASIDESSIRNIPGIVKVVQQESFLGVVAETEWAAIQASRALKVTWSTPGEKLPANKEEMEAYLKTGKVVTGMNPVVKKGDAEEALSRASKTFQATYRMPFQMHGMLGPSCAVADVQGDRATVWTGTQAPFLTREQLANLLGIPQENVRVIQRESAGCYGRLEPDDVPQDAVLMSRAVGKPVRVQWMRGDEHGWSPKGPPHFISVRAGVDDQGKIVAWDYVDRSLPWTDCRTALLAARQVGIKPGPPPGNLQTSAGEIYQVENQKILAQCIEWQKGGPIPLRTSNLRSPGSPGRCLASEGFMDEMASALGVDPVQFRLRHLTNNKRPAEVLLAAAQKAAWKERPSPVPPSAGPKLAGRGIALTQEFGTVVAAVAEVEVDKDTGKVSVQRITIAHDCGRIINPDGVRMQIDGNVIQGVSRTLFEEVQYDATSVKSVDWKTYPVITFQNVPAIEIVLVNRPEMESHGAGEPAIIPIPAAIANAVFDATGVRFREVPLTPPRVLSALKSGPTANQRA